MYIELCLVHYRRVTAVYTSLSDKLTFVAPSVVLHHVHPKLYKVPGADLLGGALLRALAEPLIVDERAIAALGVLKEELK